MKIESRVEALENELKILKSEIQSTLLEIREQVLNHYYPELRAEDAPRAKPLATKPSDARPSKNGASKNDEGRSNGNSHAQRAGSPPAASEIKGQAQPFADIFLQDLGEDDDFGNDFEEGDLDNRYTDNEFDNEFNDEMDDEIDDEVTPDPRSSSAPKTREVDFQQLRQSPAAPKTKKRAAPRNAPEKVDPLANRRTFAALAAWVGDGVTKVGKERTIQVVETYAASGGALSPETKSSILQLASLASDEEPATSVGNQEMLGLMVALDQILAE